MTFKIDGLTYPNVGSDMLAHKTLGPILRSVMRAHSHQENYMFLDAVAKGEKPSNLFKGFIDQKKAKYMINLSSSVRKPMQDAGDMGNFYDKKLWKTGIKAAAAEINGLVDSNVSPKVLMENTAFRAHHHARMWKNRANLYKKWKKMQEMKKVFKFLGDTQDAEFYSQVSEAYAALKYKPKASKRPLDKIASAAGKPVREVRGAFKKFCKV